MAVYFCKRMSDGFIKIGRSDSPERRVALLSCNHKDHMWLMATIVILSKHGRIAERMKDAKIERLLHFKFRDIRMEGEWFKPHSKLLKYIKTHSTNKFSKASHSYNSYYTKNIPAYENKIKCSKKELTVYKNLDLPMEYIEIW